MVAGECGPFWQGAALCMIYLTISLTFIAALSMRVDATFQAQVYGQDQLPSFRRANDTTTLTVFADSNLVTLLGANGAALNLTCSAATGGYRCVYTFPQMYQSPGKYTLNLQQRDGSPATTSATYIVDGAPPVFNQVLFSQSGGSIIATYAIKDIASVSTADCSGVASVELVVNDNILASKSFTGGACDASGTLSAAAPGLQGSTKLYLRARDRLGNAAQSRLETRELDTVPPGLPSTFFLLRSGADTSLVSGDAPTAVPVTLAFELAEPHLARASVDASSLSKDGGSSYRALTPRCVASGETQNCTVDGLRLNPLTGALNITITATDASGNVATGTAFKTLTVENTKPLITYLGRSSNCEQCFFSTGANDLLAIVEAPGGMRGAGLFFSMDAQNVVARNCTNTAGSTWACTATLNLASGSSGSRKTVKVGAASMDDLGNPVTGVLERSFTLDNGKPTLIGQPKADASCPTAGQTLKVVALVRDENSPSLTVWGNTSQVTSRDTTESACTSDGNKTFTCTLTIEGFLSTHTSGTVQAAIRDEAGNEQRFSIKLEVCEAAIDSAPHYIKSLAPSGTLPSVDKRIASLIPYRVAIPLKLDISGAKAIQVKRVTCDNPWVQRNAYVMNEFSTSPILVAYFNYGSVWPNGTVPLSCSFDFVIRKGNTVYVKPETVNLNLSLPAVRQELGNPVQATRDKMRSLSGEINDLQGRIDSKAKVDKTLGTICSYAENIGKVNSALAALKTMLYAVSMILIASGVLAAAGKALWSVADLGLSNIHQKINTYVWPPGWLPSAGDPMQAIGYFVKYSCALYTCKLYQVGTWSSFGTEMTMKSDLFKSAMDYEGLKIDTAAAQKEFDENGKLVDTDSTVPYDEQIKSKKEVFDKSMAKAKEFNKNIGYSLVYQDTGELRVNSKTGVVTDTTTLTELKANTKDFKPSEWTSVADRQTQMASTINSGSSQLIGGDWIVNPYTNAPYDGLCYPAQLYNLRKEKQLKCIQLKCIDNLAKQGLSTASCDEKFATQSCLYVEGAQSRLHSNLLAERLLASLGQVVLQMSISVGMVIGYRYACPQLFSLTSLGSAASAKDQCSAPGEVGISLTAAAPESCGWRSAACGLFGVAISLPEILDMMNNPWAQWSTVPEGEDYCDGLIPWNVTKDTSV